MVAPTNTGGNRQILHGYVVPAYGRAFALVGEVEAIEAALVRNCDGVGG